MIPRVLLRGARLLHGRFVFRRRVAVLARHLARELPEGVRVLDVGCGTGDIAFELMRLRPDLAVEGLDILPRAETRIPVRPFSGLELPYESASADFVLFVDVLHHAEEPVRLLREAARVATRGVLVKDHLRETRTQELLLRWMDWGGNRPHGVPSRYRYWSQQEWRSALADAGLAIVTWKTDLGIYGWPLHALLDRSLHVLCRLEPRRLG